MGENKQGTGDKLNKAGVKLPIPIEVRTQPAQSPDLNICDLALFRALKCAVRKVRRGGKGEGGKSMFDVEQLVADVKAAFADYSAILFLSISERI